MKGKMTTMIASAVLVMTGTAVLESPALSNSINQQLTNEQQTPVLAGRPRRRSSQGVQPIGQQTPVLASSQNRGGYEVESNNNFVV